jgi:hypothetical protein
VSKAAALALGAVARQGRALVGYIRKERSRAERKGRGTRPRRGSYVGIRTRHARGGGGYMGCVWSGGGGR